MKKVFVCLLAICLLAGFTGFVTADEYHDVSAHVLIKELNKFLGNGALEVGKTYDERAKNTEFGYVGLKVLNKNIIYKTHEEYYECKLYLDLDRIFEVNIVAHDGMEHKLVCRDDNYKSVFRTSLGFDDGHYTVTITPLNMKYLIKW